MADQSHILDDRALDILFREARTFNAWQDKEVSDVLLQALYDLLKWAPTEANSNPMRVKFVKSKEAKEKLRPILSPANVDKTMAAPVTALIASDLEFYNHLPRLFPHTDAKSWYEGKAEGIQRTATRGGLLQGAYLILAARALGLDCGPMAGFKVQALKDAFFADENVQIHFICNLGYGDKSGVFPRNPRFEFDEVCEIL